MSRATRSSTRSKNATPTTGTPSTVVSSVFGTGSSRNSVVDTPMTSDGEQEQEEEEKPKRVVRGRKRKQQSEDDSDLIDKQDEELPVARPAAKKRAITNRAYVQVPLVRTNSTSSMASLTPVKVNGKDDEDDVEPEPEQESEFEEEEKPKRSTRPRFSKRPQPKGKGNGKRSSKGKGKARAKPSDNSGSELEYDEDQSLEDSSQASSESSGSEFEGSVVESEVSDEMFDSDEEEEYTSPKSRSSRKPRKVIDKSDVDDQDDEVDEEELELAEEVVLEAAMRLSRGEDVDEASGSQPYVAAVRAAAAERLLAKANGLIDDDDDVDMLSDLSEEEPLSKKAKGKGKAKAKDKGKDKKATKASKKAPKPKLTKEDLKKLRQGASMEDILERKEAKRAERELRKQLGRKLTWAEKSTLALHRHHPVLRDVWGDLSRKPIATPTEVEQPKGIKLTLLPFQKESLSWMKKQEAGEWAGGMLADEMGMGKTIQIISLFVSDRQKPNLVVAPTVAIMQWRNEIEAHTDDMKVCVWHGQARESDVNTLKKYDVVLTTYAVLESSFRKQQKPFKKGDKLVTVKSPLHQIKWNRIVLDEAHNIKERSTNTAKAAFELNAKYRWCLSGTPLQNRVGELYSLVRFLGGDPFSYYFCKKCDCKSLHWKYSNKRTCDDCGHTPMQHTCFWNNEILTPIQKNGMSGPGETAFTKLKILLDRMMLRRTKLQRADDLGLPPRTVIVRNDYFSPEEKELYLSLFSDAKRQFNTYLDHGTILNNYSNIFSLLTRMRQMACHPDLVLRSKTSGGVFIPDESEATVCRICNDVAEDAIQSKCRHIFDRECIKQYLSACVEDEPACPICRLPLTIDLEGPALELEQNNKARQGILGRLDLTKWRSSTKIEALVEELSNLRLQDSTTKSIVFSQFVNFLDLIAYRLQKAGFKICRLEGTMTPQARDATIKHFMNTVDVTVFLVSLKAGGVALNLTEASRVYLMDSWWNPAVEYQAMDRIHRLGQHRPVKAIKLVVEDSIESRIVQLQEKKSAMIDAALSTDDSAMGRLTPEDLGFLFRM